MRARAQPYGGKERFSGLIDLDFVVRKATSNEIREPLYRSDHLLLDDDDAVHFDDDDDCSSEMKNDNNQQDLHLMKQPQLITLMLSQ